MVRSLIISAIVVAVVAVTLTTTTATTINNSVVEKLSIPRYMGEWYEIARFDNRFERGLRYVTAHYQLQEDSLIKVTNRGYKTKTKEWKTAEGVAKRTDREGKLRVSFFWKFFADYNILALGESSSAQPYQWALVSGGYNNQYLWILSRHPTLNENTLRHIQQIITSRGYDVNKLIFVNSP